MPARQQKYIYPTIIAIALAVAPLFAPRYFISLLAIVFSWIILAVSWHFFCGSTKYISLGSAAFFGTGFYITALFGKSLPIFTVILLGGVISFLLSFCIGLVTLRLKGMYFAIFTYGLSELLKNTLIWLETVVWGTPGRFVVNLDIEFIYYIMLVLVFVVNAFFYLLRRTRFGYALKAIGESEDTAEHVGINTTIYKTIGFSLSSLFMGVVGSILVTRWTYVDPRMGFSGLYSFMPAIMTIFGGIESKYGPILGAVILSLLSEILLTGFKEYYMVILGAVLLFFVVLLPKGLYSILEKISQKFSQRGG